jgi:hypothetical protein
MPGPREAINYADVRPNVSGIAPTALLESLERSKAQVEAGLSVPLEPALDRLRTSIARMKANRAEQD